jgi:hypothetical protein
MILYPMLLLGFTLYITREFSPLWLIVVFILCYIVSVLRSASSHKRRKCSAYDVYDYDERNIYL